jgi:hypothetical protein
MAQFRRNRGSFLALEPATNDGRGRSCPRLEKGQKMKNIFQAALVAGMVALTGVGASAAGIGIHTVRSASARIITASAILTASAIATASGAEP